MVRAASRKTSGKPPLAEWIVAAIGAIIVIGVLVFLLLQALRT